MTFALIVIALLLITIIPLIFWIKAYRTQKMRYGFIGVAISILGIGLCLYFASSWQILSDYNVTKIFIGFVLAVLGNGPVLVYYHYEEYFDSEAFQIFAAIFVACMTCVIISSGVEAYVVQSNNIETTIYTEIAPENIELISLNSGMGVEGRMNVGGNMFAVVGSGYVNSEPVYFYYHRNENGAIIRSYVPSDSKTSQIFDVLEPNEQAYLQIINTIEMKTDNNVSPAEITKKVIKTEYNFYVPKNTVPVEFEMNLN